MSLPTALIIDDDPEAVQELAGLLLAGGHCHRVLSSPGGTVPVNLLFIRIGAWDAYRAMAIGSSGAPLPVIFLSGRREKCTPHVAGQVDFHLQPPYKAGALRKLFRQLGDPAWTRQSLDFLFIRSLCRYYAIAFSELRQIEARSGGLILETETKEIWLPGTLDQVQERLPPCFHRVSRHRIAAQRCLFSHVLPIYGN
jgi:DNA-binding LytR/AlgR family response regulator